MTQLEEKLDHLIKASVAARLFPACAVGVISHGRRTIAYGGTLTYETTKELKADSLFDVASLTKSIPTSCLALRLIESGKLALNDKVIDTIPELSGPQRESITIWNLLTQTLNLGFNLSGQKHMPAETIMQAIFSSDIKPSKTIPTYSNATSILLGLVVERVHGQSLASAAQDIFFDPLQMNRTTFEPLKVAAKEDIVPTEVADWRGGLVQGEVHDESAKALRPKPVGSAGLFSTAPDMLNFMELLLSEGRLNGRRFFSKATLSQMRTNQLGGSEYSTGLGWELNQPRFMGRFAQDTFGKTGFTGCMFLCNPDLQAGLVILSNHIYPKRRSDYSAINRFRASVADEVFGRAQKGSSA